MSEPKIYVPKSSAKAFKFNDGNETINLSFKTAEFIEFIKTHTNEKGYINLNVSPRRQTGEYGDTHSVSLNPWKPRDGQTTTKTPPTRQSSAPSNVARNSPAPAPSQDDDSDVPF